MDAVGGASFSFMLHNRCPPPNQKNPSLAREAN